VTCDIHTPAMCETGGSNESGKRGAGNLVVNDLCILKDETAFAIDKRIVDAKTVLSAKLSDLTGIDLDVTNEIFLKEHYDYWLIVCTDSLCLYGPNKYFKSEVNIDGAELANLWNPNTQRLIHVYRDKLSSTDDPDEIKKICKLVGKDILKSYRPELMEKYDLFHKSIPQTCADLCEKNRDKEEQFLLLLDLYLNHTADKAHIMKVLDLVESQ
jgi:hypothetical protein